MRRAWLFVMPVGKLKRASAPGPSGEDGQEPRGREHADVVRRGRTGAPSAQSRGWMPRADQAGAVGQHEEAVGQAQAGGGDGGHDGIQGAGGARAWLPAVRSSPVFVNCWPWDVCQVARRILGVISMDYPDEVDGVALHKSETAESGYKGVTAVRLPVPGFRARDGQKMLGTYDTRIEAAVMFARSRLCAREEKHHARKDDRRLGKKRKTGVEQEKPELAAANTHAAADLHYDHAEASRYTARNAQIQDELASRCLELLHRGEGNVAKHQLLLDLGCGSGLSGRMMEAVGHTWLGIDIAHEMLALAAAGQPKTCAGLIQGDLALLPLQARARFDGALSVSTLQWLCEGRGAGGGCSTELCSTELGAGAVEAHPGPDVKGNRGGGALKSFFNRLHGALRPGAHAVFQFYPSPHQAHEALQVVEGAGFQECELLVEMPHASRACKMFLCASKCHERAPHPERKPPRARRRVCALAWPQPATCVCSSPWLPSHARPAVYPATIEGAVGCCTFWSSHPASSSASTDPNWLHELYSKCRAHATEVEAGARKAPPVDAACRRVQEHHVRHVRRLINCLAHERCAGQHGVSMGARLEASSASASAPIQLALYVSGDGVAATSTRGPSGCEDAAVVVLEGAESDLEQLSREVVAELGAMQLALDHVVCEQMSAHVYTGQPGVADQTPVPVEAHLPSCEERETRVWRLSLPAAAPHGACRVRANLPSLAAAACSWAAGIRTAHDHGLVVSAAQLIVAPSHSHAVAADGHASNASRLSFDQAEKDAGAVDVTLALAVHRRGVSGVYAAEEEPLDQRAASDIVAAMLTRRHLVEQGGRS